MINKLQQLFNKENQNVRLQLQDDLSFAQPCTNACFSMVRRKA